MNDDAAGAGAPHAQARALDQAAEGDAGLRASLHELSRVTMTMHTVTTALTRIVGCALRAVPNATGAGLILLQDDRLVSAAASDEFVRQIDAVRRALREGPCLTAVARGRTMTSGSLGGEAKWPRFGPRVGRLGVHSVVSLPLMGSDARVIGALDLYAHEKHAFDERAVRVAELFAVPAGTSAETAQELQTARSQLMQLTAAMASRDIIAHAVGIVMSRTGCTAGEAFDKLRAISQTEHRKVTKVAQQVREEAVRRARARHGGR